MTKDLKELTKEEFEMLKLTGLLWVIFPFASDIYEENQ